MLYFGCSAYMKGRLIMFNNKNINVFYMLLSIIFIGIIIFFIINYKNVVDIVYFFVIFIIMVKFIFEFYVK